MAAFGVYLCWVKPKSGGVPKIRGLGWDSSWVWSCILGMSPTSGFSHHKARVEHCSWCMRGEGFFYLLKMEGSYETWRLKSSEQLLLKQRIKESTPTEVELGSIVITHASYD